MWLGDRHHTSSSLFHVSGTTTHGRWVSRSYNSSKIWQSETMCSSVGPTALSEVELLECVLEAIFVLPLVYMASVFFMATVRFLLSFPDAIT